VKDFEYFLTENETLDMDRFQNLGVIKNEAVFDAKMLYKFMLSIDEVQRQNIWDKNKIVELFKEMLPNFDHKETGKSLDGRM
jgi:hypothetical protein